MATRRRRARKLIWLTPESLQAAERLSSLTGMPVSDLIELVLLELTEHEMADTPHARPRPADTPRPAARPAQVIPIDRARAARHRPIVAHRPAAADLAALHSRCTQVRAQAERARAAAVRARARAQAVLEGRGED